jgi:hypothetical protein
MVVNTGLSDEAIGQAITKGNCVTRIMQIYQSRQQINETPFRKLYLVIGFVSIRMSIIFSNICLFTLIIIL